MSLMGVWDCANHVCALTMEIFELYEYGFYFATIQTKTPDEFITGTNQYTSDALNCNPLSLGTNLYRRWNLQVKCCAFSVINEQLNARPRRRTNCFSVTVVDKGYPSR
jgi:hypothetical protein